MFSNIFIGVVLGVAVGSWVYLKLQRYTGGNSQSSLTGGALCGALTTLIAITLISIVR